MPTFLNCPGKLASKLTVVTKLYITIWQPTQRGDSKDTHRVMDPDCTLYVVCRSTYLHYIPRPGVVGAVFTNSVSVD